jgi:multiple sugar transport system permease protein
MAQTVASSSRITERPRRRSRVPWFSLAAIAPSVLIVCVFTLLPLAWAVRTSFERNNGVRSRWVGLENYSRLIEDPQFWEILLNNVVFLLAVPGVLTLALIAAALIYEQVPGHKVFRFVLFVPTIISTVVVGILFRAFFALDGPVNRLIELFGASPVNWLGEGSTAMLVIILALVWGGFGYGMVVLLAGMSSIDPSLHEAARIDGATWWQRVRKITLPLIARPIRFVSVLNVSYTFTSLFGYIFVMTSGGPGFDTTTLDYFVYNRAFVASQFGMASALALILLAIVLVLTIIQFRVTRVDDGAERT